MRARIASVSPMPGMLSWTSSTPTTSAESSWSPLTTSVGVPYIPPMGMERRVR